MAESLTAEVLVIGGGPAGAVTAMRLLERGICPVVVEREQFPRFHIGESMTGECGNIVRDLGLGEAMGHAGHPVKHGVSVFGPKGGKDWWIPVMERRVDGRLHDLATWQVRRSRFDKMLLDAAVARGCELVAGRAVEGLTGEDGSVGGARVATDGGGTVDIRAKVTLDCSGQASFLANRRITGPKYLGSYDKQIAVFSQTGGYRRDAGTERDDQPGNTHIYYKGKYHWSWAIPLDDEATSVGVVVPAEYFRATGESREDFVVRELRELNPGLADRVPDPELLEPARVVPNYSFQVRDFAGPGYICVGDAHRFVDPIFSFGLFVAVKEAGLAAQLAADCLAGRHRREPGLYHEYMVKVESATDILEDLIDTFWENPLAFAYLVHSDRHRDGVIDIFSGRIYEEDGLPTQERDAAIAAMRRLLGRERSYRPEDLYSMPIGSRFHPERAPLWNADLDPVAATEGWMRDR